MRTSYALWPSGVFLLCTFDMWIMFYTHAPTHTPTALYWEPINCTVAKRFITMAQNFSARLYGSNMWRGFLRIAPHFLSYLCEHITQTYR